jgi:hypothetical protein
MGVEVMISYGEEGRRVNQRKKDSTLVQTANIGVSHNTNLIIRRMFCSTLPAAPRQLEQIRPHVSMRPEKKQPLSIILSVAVFGLFPLRQPCVQLLPVLSPCCYLFVVSERLMLDLGRPTL